MTSPRPVTAAVSETARSPLGSLFRALDRGKELAATQTDHNDGIEAVRPLSGAHRRANRLPAPSHRVRAGSSPPTASSRALLALPGPDPSMPGGGRHHARSGRHSAPETPNLPELYRGPRDGVSRGSRSAPESSRNLPEVYRGPRENLPEAYRGPRHRSTICARYERGFNARRGSSLRAGGFHACVRVEQLPQALHNGDHAIYRGYAVGFGQWFFFPALEPAIAFGRSARMSTECPSYAIYMAAAELQFCQRHQRDERVLLITGHSLHRRVGNEVDVLKRFVQAVKENPYTPHWRSPTGFLTELVRGRPVQSHRRSLPL